MLRTIQKLQNGNKVFIVCAGDSITEQNYHVHGKLNYVGQLCEELINRFGRKSFVLNTGVSGDTTWGVLDRLNQDVLRFRPDLVTLMIGINDSRQGLDRLVDFKRNLEVIIEKIHSVNSEVLLLTQNPLNYEINANVAERASYPQYAKTVREVAAVGNIPLCDIYEEWENHMKDNTGAYWTFMNDSLHPNEYGHDFISKTLFKYLQI